MKLNEAIRLDESAGREEAILLESNRLLSDIATVKKGMRDADFWLVRRGSENEVGRPVKEFNPEHIGIKVTSNEMLPQFLFYAMQNMHNQGVWKRIATGTTNLVNIRADDVKKLRLGG